MAATSWDAALTLRIANPLSRVVRALSVMAWYVALVVSVSIMPSTPADTVLI